MRKLNLWTFALLIFVFSVVFANDDMFKRGLKYAEAGKLDEAIQILSEDVAENPTADRYLALGIVHLQKGDYDLALKNLKESVKLNPNSIPAVYSLAMLYEKKQLHSYAIAQWKRFLLMTKDRELKNLARRHIRQLEVLHEEDK